MGAGAVSMSKELVIARNSGDVTANTRDVGPFANASMRQEDLPPPMVAFGGGGLSLCTGAFGD